MTISQARSYWLWRCADGYPAESRPKHPSTLQAPHVCLTLFPAPETY